MTQIHVNGYKRITKRAAFTAYKNGQTIYLIPVKLAPGGFWHPEIPIKNGISKLLALRGYFYHYFF